MKQVLAYGGLLAVSLVGTYLTWFSEETDADTEDLVAVYAGSAKDLQSVTWKAEKLTVVLSQKTDAKGPYPWIAVDEDRAKRRDHREPPEPGEEPEPPEPPEMETHHLEFLGNEQATKLWEAFGPLHAMRELKAQGGGAIPMEDFGFEGDDAATVEVVKGGTSLTIDVGGETYGSKDRYIRYDGRVYLVDKDALRPLQFAKTRLVERQLYPLGEKDVEKVEVTAPGGTATFVQSNRDDRAKAFWARAETPTQEDSAGGSWMGKVFKLKVQKFDEALPERTETALTLRLSGEGETWTVKVLRDAGDGPARQFYAESDYSRGPVVLTRSVASDVIADLEAILTPTE